MVSEAPGSARSAELLDAPALGEAFARAADDEQVTRVLVRGEGPVFCAGIDLDSLAAGLSDKDARGVEEGGAELQRPFMALERAGKPSVCAVQGGAFGAGLQLALACDLRVIGAGTRLGFFEIRYGVSPDLGGTHRTVQLLGPARAKDLVLTGRDIDADEAYRIGLVDGWSRRARRRRRHGPCWIEIGGRSAPATIAAKTTDRCRRGWADA